MKNLLNEMIEQRDKKAAPINNSFKAVAIIGTSYMLRLNRRLDHIKTLYNKEGYLLLGDAATNIHELDLSVLKDRLNKTRIDIWAHGSIKDDRHTIDGGIPTRGFLSKLSAYNADASFNIHLHSCYGGAAAREVEMLTEDSVLTTHAVPDSVTCTYLNYKTIVQSIHDLRTVDPVQDFINRFDLNIKQGATISIKRKDGIFKHTVNLPKHVLSNPSEIGQYLKQERLEFIKAYNEEFSINTYEVPEITLENAIQWNVDNLIYSYRTEKELVGLDKEKNKLLTEFEMRCTFGVCTSVSFEDLVVLNNEKIKLLGSPEAVNAYKTGKVTYKNLADLNEEKIKLLISNDAINAYKFGKVSFQDFADLDEGRIKLLLSHSELYEFGHI